MNVFEKYTDKETFSKIVDWNDLTEMWENSVRCYSDDVAIVDDGAEYTYAALDRDISAYRTLLARAGVTKGSLIGILSPNSVGFVKAYLAANTLGAATVLLPAHLDNMTVLGISMKFGLGAIAYDSSLEEKVALVREKNPATALIDTADDTEELTPAVHVDPSALSTVIFTGGTTGKSKGARLSHRAVLAGTKNGCYGIKEIFGQRYFLVLPLTHVFGLVRNLLTCLYTGSAMFICKNNKDMFRDIAVFKPTIFVVVPALAEMALNLSRQFGRNMLGADMKTIICGAAAVAPYLVSEYDKMGIALFPGYGLTESANLVSGNPESLRKPDSVGYIYPGMEYKTVDGELWLKGVNMMDGYVGGEDNEIAYVDGWFRTGDLVRIDDEGFLYITGRIKEVIVLQSGENVSPQELEAKFYAIDAIQDCMIFEYNGALALELVPRMSVLKAAGVTDVGGYIKARVDEVNATLPAFERVNKIIIRDTDFVRTPAMKIARDKNGIVKE